MIVLPLDELTEARQGDGFSAREMLRDDREWIACWKCRKKHPLRHTNADGDAADFRERHPIERGCIVLRVSPEQMETIMRRAQKRRELRQDSVADFFDNATVLEAWQASQALDLTGIGIASSVTAGWCSCWIDNSSSLYLDIVIAYYFSQAVNTAASSQKAHYLYGPGSDASANLPYNTAGNSATNSSTTSGTLTYLDITANAVGFPLLGVVPYITTNKPLQGGMYSFAKCHENWCPKFCWLGLVNAAGPTIGTGGTPATAIKYAGASLTVS